MRHNIGVSLKSRLLKLFFPPKCMFCRKIMKEGFICSECRGNLPYCVKKRRSPEFCCGSVSALRYTGIVRRAVLSMKFFGKSSYALGFAELLAETVQREIPGKYDVVTWVPVSEKRLRKRGYDQAELLAVRTAELLGMPSLPLLKKVRHTPAQSGFHGLARRRANISGAYEAVSPETIKGQRILLIDDVLTTGATLSESARVLQIAGAENVIGATAARAGFFQ